MRNLDIYLCTDIDAIVILNIVWIFVELFFSHITLKLMTLTVLSIVILLAFLLTVIILQYTIEINAKIRLKIIKHPLYFRYFKIFGNVKIVSFLSRFTLVSYLLR